MKDISRAVKLPKSKTADKSNAAFAITILALVVTDLRYLLY